MTAPAGAAAAADRGGFRVLFAGTPQTAVPSLDALVGAGFSVVAVLTRPDAPVGRKRVPTPSPVAARAAELGIPVLHASRLSGDAGRQVLDRIAALDVDAAAVVAYGALVPAAGLALPRHGWVNLHFSLLPSYRGAAPVQHAIIAQEPVTGACVFRLEEGLDTGPVFSRLTRELIPGETAGEVLADLAGSGAELLATTLAAIQDGAARAEPQSGEPSLAPKLTQRDGYVDAGRPASEVAARINGTTPEPGAWALLGAVADRATTPDGHPVRVKLLGAVPERATAPGEASQDEPQGEPGGEPGEVVLERDTVRVRCAEGAVRLQRVQPAGKKAMSAADWARGLPQGARFLTGPEGAR